MRITQGMLSNNMLNNLMHSQNNMNKYLEQIYTGKRISRPSDDPVIATKGMDYRTQVAEVEQYQRNTREIRSWMDNSDAALDKGTQALHRLRELTNQAATSTVGSSERQSIKEEVEQLREHLIDIANTNVNGKYIFNGADTENPPFNKDGTVSDSFNATGVNIEVSKGITVQVNMDGTDIFGIEGEGEDKTSTLFQTIDKLIDRLDVDDEDESIEVDKSLEDLDEVISNFVDGRANLGARMNRLELIEDRLEEQKVVATKTMSDNEDVHFEEAITNLITQESLHRAALAAGSRVIQPTLIDFLR